MEASEYGIEKESRGRLRQTIVESDQDSSRTGSDGRPVRRSFNVPRFTPVGLESRSHFSCLNDCIPIAQTYAERRQRRGDSGSP